MYCRRNLDKVNYTCLAIKFKKSIAMFISWGSISIYVIILLNNSIEVKKSPSKKRFKDSKKHSISFNWFLYVLNALVSQWIACHHCWFNGWVRVLMIFLERFCSYVSGFRLSLNSSSVKIESNYQTSPINLWVTINFSNAVNILPISFDICPLNKIKMEKKPEILFDIQYVTVVLCNIPLPQCHFSIQYVTIRFRARFLLIISPASNFDFFFCFLFLFFCCCFICLFLFARNDNVFFVFFSCYVRRMWPKQLQ